MTDRYSHLRLQHHLSKQEQLTEHQCQIFIG
jgi:hypothetical protein